MCRDLRVRLDMLAVNCAWYNVTEMSYLFDAAELEHSIHGGAVEADNAVLRIEGATGIGWQTQDLNADGACGDATRADAALGWELVERAAKALAALVLEMSRFRL